MAGTTQCRTKSVRALAYLGQVNIRQGAFIDVKQVASMVAGAYELACGLKDLIMAPATPEGVTGAAGAGG